MILGVLVACVDVYSLSGTHPRRFVFGESAAFAVRIAVVCLSFSEPVLWGRVWCGLGGTDIL